MPDLPLATETDTAPGLGTPVSVGELPTAVDSSLPIAVQAEVALPIEASTAYGELPTAVESAQGDAQFDGLIEVELPSADGFGAGAFGTSPFGAGTSGGTVTVPGRLQVWAQDDLPAATQQDMALPLTVLVDDAAFATAIEDIDRTPVFTLKADWGRTGLFDHDFSDLTNLVEEVTVDRVLIGELPPEVGLVDGTTSATMSVQLAGRWTPSQGDGLDPVDVFGPYRPDSPLYGQPVMQSPIQLETGFVTASGPRLDRRFTGTVAQINPASGARTVQITGLDASHRLRESITLTGVGQYTDILERRGSDAYLSRINSQWLIDHILRRNGIFTSPPPRPEAVLSVTGHGSMIPEIGWGGAPQEYYSTYRGPKWYAGRFGGALATVSGDIGRWWLDEQVTAAAGSGFGYSMWLGMYPGDGIGREMFAMDLTPNRSWYVAFGVNGSGIPYTGLFSPSAGSFFLDASGGYTAPTSAVWQFVGVHLSFTTTTMTARFRVGGVTVTKTMTIAARASNWKPGLYMNYTWKRTFTNFQMWKSATPPGAGQWQGETWIPQADLDMGVNELTGIPQITGEDSMELIKEICAAEGSTFEFTEEGRPRFRTRVGDEARGEINDVTERITADRNLADLVSTTDETSIRNIVNVKVKKLTVSGWQDYYEAPTILVIPPGVSYFEVELPTAAYELPPTYSDQGSLNKPGDYAFLGGDGFIFYSTNELWEAGSKQVAAKPYIRVMFARADNPSIWHGPNMPIRVVRLSPWKMQIIIGNLNSFSVQLSTTEERDANGVITRDAEPALIIPARIVEEGEEQLETYTDNASVQLYGPSTYDVGGSADRWRQTPEGLRGLASSVLAATSRPVPVLDAVDVPHDPRRRLRDRVVLEDPDGLGEVAATVVGLSTTYTNGPAVDRLTVRPIAPPGLGLLGDATVGLIGLNLVLG